MWNAQPPTVGAAQPQAPTSGLHPPANRPASDPTSPADRSASYLPGYLSKIKETRPYSSPLNGGSVRPIPDQTEDVGNDSVALLVPHRQPSVHVSTPQHAFSSSFFKPRHSSKFNDSFASTSGFGTPGAGPNASFGGTSFRASNSPAPRGRESVFGPAGLRARPTPVGGDTLGHNSSFSMSQAPAASPPGDDNVPPPAQSLDDEDAMDASGATAPGAAVWPTASATSLNHGISAVPQATPTLGLPQSNTADSKLRTLYLFGFPRSLETLVVEHFGFGLVSSEWIALAKAVDGPGYLEVVYSDMSAAFRALRRSGELVAGAAMVGVRVKDDDLHRTLLLEGLGGASASASSLNETSPHLAPGTPNPRAVVQSPSQARPRAGRASMGRPLSVIGTSDAALAPPSADQSSSFLRLSGWSSPAPKAQNTDEIKRSSSFFGRVNDAVFGW